MKITNLIPAALLTLALIPSAHAGSAPFLSCGDGRGLPNGLSVSLSQDEFGTVATVSDRENIGRYENLGFFRVAKKPVPKHIMGAPLVYVGEDFELILNVDVAPTEFGIPARLRTEINGQRFSQNMYCFFLNLQ